MPRPWYRSRLFWLGVPGFAAILWAWLTPLCSHEGGYFSARWIAPGNFYQGFGVTQDFHRLELWLGRPYAGLGNPFRQTGVTRTKFPFEEVRHSWANNETGPIWFEWGNPSADSFTIALDYWFLLPAYLAAWTGSVAFWQRRKRSRAQTPHDIPTNSKAQQVEDGDTSQRPC